jgi:low temperature requirement protein LtrA
MVGRDPKEAHRTATPLELLFDLTFVVAVAQAAAALHHDLGDGHAAHGVVSYTMVFFAIWWAWMNFTWFASAYDNDDVPYRLAVLVMIAGSLVLAAGIGRGFDHGGNVVVVVGYVIMRLAMVTQWLRAAASDPPRRGTDRRYAAGVTIVQLYWLLLLLVPQQLFFVGFVIAVVAELAVPVLAERKIPTTFHPHHIAERYGLFTVIVLGESVTAATLAFQGALDEAENGRSLIGMAVAGVVILFCLWWMYFDHEANPRLDSARSTFIWGYGHYVVFSAAAAVGAGLVVAVAYRRELTEGLSAVGSALAVAVPVVVYLLAVSFLHHHSGRPPVISWSIAAACVLILGGSFLPGSLYVTAAVLAVLVAVITAATRTRLPIPADGDSTEVHS